MMCLGWANRATCLTRGAVELVPSIDGGPVGGTPGSGVSSSPGPVPGAPGANQLIAQPDGSLTPATDTTWFWAAVGVLAVGAIARAGSHKKR